ncbi:hypothetical protein ACFLZ1_02135 [Patescibacteria group bacterium]
MKEFQLKTKKLKIFTKVKKAVYKVLSLSVVLGTTYASLKGVVIPGLKEYIESIKRGFF